MTKAKHTPGPWAIRRVNDADGHLVYCLIGPAKDLKRMHGVGYAGTYGKRRDGSTAELRLSDAECDANARLIAAAPDLLAACEKMFGMALARRGWLPSDRPAFAEAQAAIAKAKGGTA